MGCASSTPMIQNSGSEMLKAATHVATDATKTAEEAVEGIKDSVGKSLDTAKDSVATAVESVKHEVENVVKDKTEMLEDAKNSLMEKLHLKQNENESNNENSENIVKTETDELQIQLNENIKNNTDDNVAQASSEMEQTEAMKEIKEHVTTRTDTETDSLNTSTPEPEIIQAFAKSQNNQDDDNDNPPTPKPTIAELEILTREILKEQQQQQQQQNTNLVNDMTTMSNDPVISVKHENIKAVDSSNNTMSLTAGKNTIKDNEPATITTTTLENNDFKATNVHNTPKNPTAVSTNHLQPVVTGLTSTLATTTTKANSVTAANQPSVVKDKEKQKKSKNHLKEENKNAEKRPRTTEWEKFADMLAHIRKFNPHDAFRRGGTYTKFGGGGGGIGQPKERSFLGHNVRSGMEDDVSDTTSNFRGSPQNSQRSSARALGRISRLPNRPNTGTNRCNHNELPKNNGAGHYAYKTRRSINIGSTTGRKFDYNPTRSRVNEFVSSTPFIKSSFLQNTVAAQLPYAPYSTSNEDVRSPPNMRSHHSRSEMVTLPPLESLERLRSRSQPSQNHQHFDNFTLNHNDNSMKLHYDFNNTETPIFVRQSSYISLSSNSSEGDNYNSIKSSHLEAGLQNTKLPTVKNTSSFLTTPRCSPFSLRKSYTDLYFSTTRNKENKPQDASDKSPFRKRKSCNVCSKKHFIK